MQILSFKIVLISECQKGGGGKTLLTLNMSGGGVCYNFETGATDCMVSKDKVGDNVTKTTVDGDAHLTLYDAFEAATDCMVSKDNVTKTTVDGDTHLTLHDAFEAATDCMVSKDNVTKTTVDGDTHLTLHDAFDVATDCMVSKDKVGGVCYNFDTGATDCMVSKDKVGDNVTKTTVDGDTHLTLHDAFDVATDCMVSKDKVGMSDGEGGDISPTQEVGGTSSTLNTSGDWGFVNSETETTDCMVSEDAISNLTLQNGSDIRLLAEGNLGILMELMRESDQDFLEQVLAILFLLIAEVGVNKWIFSSPSPSFSLHQQILVSFRYRRCRGACVFRCDVILFHRKVRVQMFYAPGEGLQGYCDRGMLWMKDDDEDNVESSMAEEEMIGEEEMGLVDDVSHVIDEVEEDVVSQEEVTDEKGLVDDERQSNLSVSTGMSTVSYAAVHNVGSSMAEEEMICDELRVIDEVEEDEVSQEEMIGDELHVIDDVEEDDVSQEEVTDEKGLVDDERQSFLSVSTGMSTVSHAAVHKELVGMLLMKDDDEDDVESSMAEEEMIGDELHVIDEVEEDDVSQEEMFGEEEMGLGKGSKKIKLKKLAFDQLGQTPPPPSPQVGSWNIEKI